MQAQQKRQVAYKVRITDILNNEYVKKEGWQPNSITIRGNEVSRVNLIATVVTKPEQEFNHTYVLLDDGTAKISARSFEASSAFASLEIGDVVLVIARPREYNGERYLIPEIVRKIVNSRWIEFRDCELRNEKVFPRQDDASILSRVHDLIKKLDLGDGASYQQVVDEINSVNAEDAIGQLLKEGEIFEIRPGRLKLLS